MYTRKEVHSLLKCRGIQRNFCRSCEFCLTVPLRISGTAEQQHFYLGEWERAGGCCSGNHGPTVFVAVCDANRCGNLVVADLGPAFPPTCLGWMRTGPHPRTWWDWHADSMFQFLRPSTGTLDTSGFGSRLFEFFVSGWQWGYPRTWGSWQIVSIYLAASRAPRYRDSSIALRFRSWTLKRSAWRRLPPQMAIFCGCILGVGGSRSRWRRALVKCGLLWRPPGAVALLVQFRLMERPGGSVGEFLDGGRYPLIFGWRM